MFTSSSASSYKCLHCKKPKTSWRQLICNHNLDHVCQIWYWSSSLTLNHKTPRRKQVLLLLLDQRKYLSICFWLLLSLAPIQTNVRRRKTNVAVFNVQLQSTTCAASNLAREVPCWSFLLFMFMLTFTVVFFSLRRKKTTTTTYLEWKMWLQGNFLAPVTISSRQMIQTLSEACRSSGVASGYLTRRKNKQKKKISLELYL